MQRILTVVGIWLSIANGYATVWTDCSEAFESVEIAAQTITLPSPAEIDYKVGLGKEFREALANRPDINWNAVADNYREWSEHTTTLSGPARMLVACVLTAATNGLGTKWLAGHGITEGTATHAALSAGIQAVVAGAGTSLAGNLGDIGKTFDELTSADFVKNLASTMLTAGISQSLSSSLQLPDKPETFKDALKTNATHGLVRTGVDSAISGGKVGKNLAQNMTTAAVDAGSAQVAHKIGDGKHSGALNQITHKAAHGALAVASAKLTGRDPVGAAIGAVVSETAAEAMDKPDASPEERQKIAQKARIIGDTVAFVAGRDVGSADSAGKTAVDNNFLGEHLTEIDAQRAMAKAVLSEEEAAQYLELLDADEKRTLEAARDPFVQTAALSAVGMGVPLVAQTAGVLGTAATAHYFGSIAVDSGAKGLVKETKDHPIMTTLAVMPFVPKGLKSTQGTSKALLKTEQAVQQEFRFVQELQPAKKVETITRETTAVSPIGRSVTSQPSLPLDIEPSSKFPLVREIPAEGPASQFTSKTLSREVEWTAPTGTQQTYHVYQRNDIDWYRIRTGGEVKSRGLTNLEAAKQGYAPEMADGSSLNLHHIGQDSRGPLVEVPSTSHKKYNKQLHQQFGYQKQNPEHPVDRATFDQERPKYWMDRAMEVESGQK